MERTMMESFCAAGNFHRFLKRVDMPSTVRDVADAIELPEEIRGTLLQTVHSDFGKTSLIKICQQERAKETLLKLDDDVIVALAKVSADVSAFTGQSWSPPRQAVKHDRVVIRGKTFSVEKTTKSTGLICIQNGTSYVPGSLREIVSITYLDAADDQLLNILFLFIVHQHLPANPKVSNPLLKYPDFGANLWSSACYTRPSVVPVFPDVRFCHGIFRKWDEKHIVVKALDRVSLKMF